MAEKSEVTVESRDGALVFELSLTADRMTELGLDIKTEYRDGPDGSPVYVGTFVVSRARPQ